MGQFVCTKAPTGSGGQQNANNRAHQVLSKLTIIGAIGSFSSQVTIIGDNEQAHGL
jgi:hypothetical protein